jgi:ActR/RegA family two-component response regulator
MLQGLPILIVEDDPFVAMDLAVAIENFDGRPVGPVASVAEGLRLVVAEPIEAAILDANLVDRDVTPLALLLIERSVPFVIHSGTGIPPELAKHHPDLVSVMKPARSTEVLAALLQQVSADRSKFATERNHT